MQVGLSFFLNHLSTPRSVAKIQRYRCCRNNLARQFCFVGWWRFACTCQQACHRGSPAAVPALFQAKGCSCCSLLLLSLLQFAFLHVKGKSGLKHTRQLLECWRERPDLPTLTVVGRFSWNEVKDSVKARNIVLHPKVCGLRCVCSGSSAHPTLRVKLKGTCACGWSVSVVTETVWWVAWCRDQQSSCT